MTKTKSLKAKTRQQYGVIPFRTRDDGALEILLVTSRDTGRWIVPKGWPVKNKKPVTSALIEAFEEAGVRGESLPEMGEFRYVKRMSFGKDRPCRVGVFPLRVTEELAEWPEREQRRRQWFAAEDAMSAVNEAGLAEMIRDLPSHLSAHSAPPADEPNE